MHLSRLIKISRLSAMDGKRFIVIKKYEPILHSVKQALKLANVSNVNTIFRNSFGVNM